jgi:hypothetical protein
MRAVAAELSGYAGKFRCLLARRQECDRRARRRFGFRVILAGQARAACAAASLATGTRKGLQLT